MDDFLSAQYWLHWNNTFMSRNKYRYERLADKDESSEENVKTKASCSAEKEDQLPSLESLSKMGHLKRHMGLFSGTSLIMGSMIGSGIFITPASVYKDAGSVGIDLMVWAAGGVLCLIGALCYAELGSMIPAAGADYAYLIATSKFYGTFSDLPAFLFSWAMFAFLDPMGIAYQGLAFAHYFLPVLPMFHDCDPPQYLIRIVATLFISLVTCLNCLTVRISTGLQDVVTVVKCTMLTAIAATGLFYIKSGHFQDSPLLPYSPPPVERITKAIYGTLFTYSGWKSLNSVAEEIIHPEKNLPRCVILGVSAVTLFYVTTNAAYFAVVDEDSLLASEAVVVTFASRAWRPIVSIIPFLIGISAFGTASASFFSTSRIYFAAGREGHLCTFLSYINIKTSIPVKAILLRGIMGVVFLFIGNITAIIEGSAFLESIFEFFAVCALFVLRLKAPNLSRPYRVPSVIAGLKLVICIIMIVIPLLNPTHYVNYIIIAGMTLGGMVFYLPFVHFKLVLPGYRRLDKFLQILFNSVPCQNELQLTLQQVNKKS